MRAVHARIARAMCCPSITFLCVTTAVPNGYRAWCMAFRIVILEFQEWATGVMKDLPSLSKANLNTDTTRDSSSSVKVLNTPKFGCARMPSPMRRLEISRNSPATSSYSVTVGRELHKAPSMSYSNADRVSGSGNGMSSSNGRKPLKASLKASDSRATDYAASDSMHADPKASDSKVADSRSTELTASSASRAGKKSSVNGRSLSGSFVGNNFNIQQRAEFIATLPRPNNEGISSFLREMSERDDMLATAASSQSSAELQTKVSLLEQANAELQRRIRLLEQQAKHTDTTDSKMTLEAAEFKARQLESELALERGQHAGHLRDLEKTIAEEKERYETLVVERNDVEEALQMEIRKMSADGEKDSSRNEETANLKNALTQAQTDIDTWQRKARNLQKELSEVKCDYEILQNDSHAIHEMRDQVRASVATINALEEENHDMSYEVDTLKEKMEKVKERFSIDMKKRGTSQKLAGRCLRAWYLYVGQAIMKENFSIVAGSALRTVTGEKFKSMVRRILSEWRFHAHCAAMKTTIHDITMESETRDLEATKHMHEVELVIAERDQAVLDMKRRDVECSALRAEIGTQAQTLKEEREAAERVQEEMAHLASEYVDARSGSSVPEYQLAKARVDLNDLRRELEHSNKCFDEMANERNRAIENHAENIRHVQETEEEAQQRCVFFEESLLHEEANWERHQNDLHDHIAQLEAQVRDFHERHSGTHQLSHRAWPHGAPASTAPSQYSYRSSAPVARAGSTPSGCGGTPLSSYVSGPSTTRSGPLGVHHLSSSQGRDTRGLSGSAVLSPHAMGDETEMLEDSGPIVHSSRQLSAVRASSVGDAHRPRHLTHSPSVPRAHRVPSPHTAVAHARLSSPHISARSASLYSHPSSATQRQPRSMTGLKERLFKSINGASSTAETPAHKFSAEVEKLEKRLYSEERAWERDTEEKAIELRRLRDFEERVEEEHRYQQQNNDDQAAEIRHLAEILHNIRVQSPFTALAEEPPSASIPASSCTNNAVAPQKGNPPARTVASSPMAHAIGPPVPNVESSSHCLPQAQPSIHGGLTRHSGPSGHLQNSNDVQRPPSNHPSVSTRQYAGANNSHGARSSDARAEPQSYSKAKPDFAVSEGAIRSSVPALPNPQLGHATAPEHTQSTPQLLRRSAELSNQNPRESTPPARTVGSGCGFGFEGGKVVHMEDVRFKASPTQMGSFSSVSRGDAVRRETSADSKGRSGLRRPPRSHNGFGPVPPLQTETGQQYAR